MLSNQIKRIERGVQRIKSIQHVPRWTAGRLEYETGIHAGWWLTSFVALFVGLLAATGAVWALRSYYGGHPTYDAPAVVQVDGDGLDDDLPGAPGDVIDV